MSKPVRGRAEKRLAVYPGTFDPPTLGHLDIIRRGLDVFDEIVVAVTDNADKRTLLSAKERVRLLRAATQDLQGVSVEPYSGLTIAFARRRGACAILRGIRTMSDFDYESHLALTNRTVGGIETVFVLADARLSYISSSLIKEIAGLGGDVSAMVPPAVLQALQKRLSGLKEA